MRIGIDLGGTKTEVIALSEQGEQLFRHRLPTPRDDYHQTIETIAHLVEMAEVVGDLPLDPPLALLPGGPGELEVVAHLPQLGLLRRELLPQLLGRRRGLMGLPVAVPLV